MPNHVTTVLASNKDVLDALQSHDVFGQIHEVDFNTMIPQPADDDPIFTATRTDYGGGSVGWSVDGYSPLEWNRHNWGTKWNAYDIDRRSDTEVRFDTAWSHPLPVIEALSRKFPDVVLLVSFADEDLGSNCGEYVMQDGVPVSTKIFEYSDASCDFAAKLKYGMGIKEYYEDMGEVWESVDK